MEKGKRTIIPYVDFPSQTASETEKGSDDFGLKVGKAIESEWFRMNTGSDSRFYSRWNDFNKLRLYARGEQPIAQYKKEMAINGDLSYINIDWSPVPIIPKFVDIVVNGMSNRLFKPKVKAEDALSQAKRMEYQDMVEGQMLAKPIIENFQKELGVDGFAMNPDDLPADDEELNLHMQLKYKPRIEIAAETAISTIFEDNDYETIRSEIDEDQVILGLSVGKHDFLKGKGLVLSRVDPARWIHSYTEDRYFRDCYYFGHVETVHVSHLKAINPSISDETIEEVQSLSGQWYTTHNLDKLYGSPFNKDTVDILNFSYKTTQKRVYKRKKTKNGEKLIEKEESFNPGPDSWEEHGFDRVDKDIEVWYEGVLVLGTDILVKWELEKNMVRPSSALERAIPKYVACASRMYKGQLDSLVKRMIPFANQIQMTHYKIQQVVARVVPDGVYLDADGLVNIDLGDGNSYNPSAALNMYFQTGSVIGRSYTTEGDMNRAKVPIEEINKSAATGKLQMLIGNYNYYLGMIRQVTGLNEARDATTPDSRALVGIQKMAALNSNTATRHILESGLWITKRMAQASIIRVADILQYSDFAEAFANQIGRSNMTILNEIKDLYLHDFGIFVEISPDEEENERLQQDIQLALRSGGITIDDKIDIEEIKNIKLASQLLKIRRKKREQDQQDREMQKDALNRQFQLESQKLAEQKLLKEIDAQGNADLNVLRGKSAFRIAELKAEAQEKRSLMDHEFNLQMQLKAKELEILTGKEAKKEDRKDKRQDRQNSQQSKLIEQRLGSGRSMNFESNEDSLDGFGLEEFSPR